MQFEEVCLRFDFFSHFILMRTVCLCSGDTSIVSCAGRLPLKFRGDLIDLKSVIDQHIKGRSITTKCAIPCTLLLLAWCW